MVMLASGASIATGFTSRQKSHFLPHGKASAVLNASNSGAKADSASTAARAVPRIAPKVTAKAE
jgi:hypothetical protein